MNDIERTLNPRTIRWTRVKRGLGRGLQWGFVGGALAAAMLMIPVTIGAMVEAGPANAVRVALLGGAFVAGIGGILGAGVGAVTGPMLSASPRSAPTAATLLCAAPFLLFMGIATRGHDALPLLVMALAIGAGRIGWWVGTRYAAAMGAPIEPKRKPTRTVPSTPPPVAASDRARQQRPQQALWLGAMLGAVGGAVAALIGLAMTVIALMARGQPVLENLGRLFEWLPHEFGTTGVVGVIAGAGVGLILADADVTHRCPTAGAMLMGIGVAAMGPALDQGTGIWPALSLIGGVVAAAAGYGLGAILVRTMPAVTTEIDGPIAPAPAPCG
ncbi:MAG: hypothetical protein AAF567_25145 [Actinomycetota bacterium]